MNKDTNDEAKPDQAVAELDAGLEKLIRSERENPFAKFECAWEFNPDLSEIPNPPQNQERFRQSHQGRDCRRQSHSKRYDEVLNRN